MIHMKIKGLFLSLPLESLTLGFICRVTNTPKEEVQPILDQLLKEDFIKGKRKYKLKKVPKHIKNIHK